jgi:hypothetical protein
LTRAARRLRIDALWPILRWLLLRVARLPPDPDRRLLPRLVRRRPARGRAPPGGDGLLTAVTTVGGAVYAATTLVAFSLDEAIYTMSDDTYNHAVYPGLIHAANDAG